MNPKDIEELTKKYQSAFAQSVIVEVLKSADGKVDVAIQALDSMSEDRSQEQIESLIRELDGFQSLGREVLLRVLKESNYDVDVALLPLFNLMEQKGQEERAKTFQIEKQRREQEARAKAMTFLKDMFKTVSQDKITEVLETHDGDVDTAMEQLFNFSRERESAEKQQKQEQEDRQRRLQIETLVVQVGFSEEETQRVLESHNWDIQKATQELLSKDIERKTKEFLVVYPTLTQKEIEEVLHDYCNKPCEAQRALVIKTKEKKEILERHKKEEERKRLEAEEARRKEEELRIQIEAEKASNDLAAQELLKKQLEEAERKKQELEKLEKQKQAEELAQKEKETLEQIKRAAEAQKRAKDVILLQSMRMAVLVNKEVAKENFLDIAKKELEEKIRGPEEPEIAKPLEPSPVRSRIIMEDTVVVEQKPPPGGQSDVSSETNAVTMKILPEQVDYGKAIVVEWDHSGESTSRDWIALVGEGQANTAYHAYEWVSQKTGSVSFVAPSISGRFQARYFTNGSYSSVGVSPLITVGPAYSLSATATGNAITVKLEQKFGSSNPSAWVAMYSKNATSPDAYYTYEWVQDKQEIIFPAPKTGSWHFKLFPQKTYVSVASCDVEVNGVDKLELSVEDNEVVVHYSVPSLDPNTDAIWLGIYKTDEGNQRQWRRRKTNLDKEGVWRSKKMIHAGDYHVRLFACGTYEMRVCSNTISIEGL